VPAIASVAVPATMAFHMGISLPSPYDGREYRGKGPAYQVKVRLGNERGTQG
jgi:hypothetical protein